MNNKSKEVFRLLKKYKFFILILIIILAGVVYSYFSKGVVYFLITQDIDSIVSFINSFGKLSQIIFILLVVLEVILAPIPPLVLYIAGGMIFGAFLGGTLVLFGNVLGAIIAFLIARTFGREIIEKEIDERITRRFDEFSDKYGGFALFLLRLNPFTTSDIFSYLAGLTKMKLRVLIVSTTLGLIPLVYIQSYLGGIFIKSNPILFLIFILVSLIYFVLFVYGLIYFFFKKKKIKKRQL